MMPLAPNSPYGYNMGNDLPFPMSPQPMMAPSFPPGAGGGGYSPMQQQQMQPQNYPTQPRYAAGGHVHNMANKIRMAGQRGDRILAHINPHEAMQLQHEHGMDINPHTGLPQFGLYDSLMSGLNTAYGYGKSGLNQLGDYAENFGRDVWKNYGHPLANQGLGYLDTAIQGALPYGGAAVGGMLGSPMAGRAAGSLLSDKYAQSGGLQGNIMPKLTGYFGQPSPMAPGATPPTVNSMMQYGVNRLGGDINRGIGGMDQNIQSRIPGMAANMGGQFGDFGRRTGEMAGNRMAGRYGNSGGISGMVSPYVNQAMNAMPQVGFAHGGHVGNFTKGSEHIRRLGQDGDDVLAHINPQEAMLLQQEHGMDINPHTGLPQFGFWDRLKKWQPFKKDFGSTLAATIGIGLAPFTGGASLALAAPAFGDILGGSNSSDSQSGNQSIAQQIAKNPIPEGKNFYPKPLAPYKSRKLKPKKENIDYLDPEFKFFEEDEENPDIPRYGKGGGVESKELSENDSRIMQLLRSDFPQNEWDAAYNVLKSDPSKLNEYISHPSANRSISEQIRTIMPRSSYSPELRAYESAMSSARSRDNNSTQNIMNRMRGNPARITPEAKLELERKYLSEIPSEVRLAAENPAPYVPQLEVKHRAEPLVNVPQAAPSREGMSRVLREPMQNVDYHGPEFQFYEEKTLPRLAKGGYLDGHTDGKEDQIDAKLSDGEYVLDAPFVALLGGGNNRAGAKVMDSIREMAGVSEKFNKKRKKKVIKKIVNSIKRGR